MLCEVALLSPPFKTYTYVIPNSLPREMFSPGTRVIVPVKNRYMVGLILSPSENPEKSNYKTREIIMPLEKKPLFPIPHLDVIMDISRHLMVEPGMVLSSFIPSGLRSLKLHFADTKGTTYPVQEILNDAPSKLLPLIHRWIKDEIELFHRKRKDFILELTTSPPWPIRPNAKIQLNILEFLYINGPQSRHILLNKFGKNISQSITTLMEKGLISQKIMDNSQKKISTTNNIPIPPTLTPEQKKAITSLSKIMGEKIFKMALLYGVTGSGKTYVYIDLIKKCLKINKSAILLLPEVALAEAIFREVKKFFPNVPIYLYHGYLSSGLREDIFKEISTQEKEIIVIGTRSSILLPIKNPGLIILDEEHDTSYKQEEKLRYHTRDIAYLLARKFNTLLVFGSATPDIRTFYASKNKDIVLLEMKKRIGDRSLPQIKLINLNEQPPTHGPFSEEVYKEIDSSIEKGDQVIILLNRRGFSPLMWCTSCREVVKCTNCSVSMTYHKKIERLICHYCGLSIPFPTNCPVCGSCSFLPLDHGTEQVEEYINGNFANKCKVLRLDRDSFRKDKQNQDILQSFAKGDYQILVGTQMCSKGHNFPGVTLVVVVDGDIGLNIPDYRATERTFQLLVQVSGRSGRGEKPGRVYIQTRNPNHYCWQYISNNNYDGFFKHELELRKARLYPPFAKIALIRFEFNKEWDEGDMIIKEMKMRIRSLSHKGLKILGPAPAPIFILKNKKRYQCLIKAEKWSLIRDTANRIINKFSSLSKRFKIILDMDPYNML